jgi:flagellar biogenesis protein FliO
MGRFQRRMRQTSVEKGMNMLWTIAVVLLALWVLGFATSYTMGGLIHILLILAVVAVVVRLIQGRRAIP